MRKSQVHWGRKKQRLARVSGLARFLRHAIQFAQT
ncbi:hypothetical protein RD1_2457 [Roseobacter denitrificans OCh 114]|uniref:Uncharacterized protein n=1 Tax=Roseobacter denitrificans (strain ATCC 33942 / OCh 114) TaxID=375451 RepID=Q166S0_ROSDO|nr:hypothetical protein RD1_2457 [Roseobacter denitrificans OCh 114]